MADTNTYDSFQKVEKWTTRDKFNALDLSTIETGTEYNLAGAIEESDLDFDLQTKINGKLTAPTTPTAESAVILGTDGTVGTKPLSEIGGGGGVQFVELFPGSTLTSDQLTILKANKGNQIIYYGGVLYYFKLAYEKSSNEWLYVTFYDSAVTLTVNMTTGSATLDTSGKLYRHDITLVNNTVKTDSEPPEKTVYELDITLFDKNIDEINTADKLIARFDNYIFRKVIVYGRYSSGNFYGESDNAFIYNLESTSKIVVLNGVSIVNSIADLNPLGIRIDNSRQGWILKTFSGSTYTADNITYTDTVVEV